MILPNPAYAPAAWLDENYPEHMKHYRYLIEYVLGTSGDNGYPYCCPCLHGKSILKSFKVQEILALEGTTGGCLE